MVRNIFLNRMFFVLVVASLLFGGIGQGFTRVLQPESSKGQSVQPTGAMPNDEIGTSNDMGQMRTTTMAMRIAAALHLNLQKKGVSDNYAGINPATAAYSPLSSVANGNGNALNPLATMALPFSPPDYFGVANWANSPLPTIDPVTAAISGGMRKFVDTLPGLCGLSPWGTSGANSLGQCIPLAAADTTTFPGSDYYEIAVVEYREQLHPDLPATGTRLRGYVQVSPAGTVPLFYPDGVTPITYRNSTGATVQVMGVTKPHYLGPLILATGCDKVVNPTGCTPRPVRVKFTNYLPTGPGGDLFLPTDTTYMGAGMGPGGSINIINVTSGGSGYNSAPAVVLLGSPCR